MADTHKKPSLEEILAEAKAKSNKNNQKADASDLMSSLPVGGQELNTLDVYIKFGQSDRPVAEITDEIKQELEQQKAQAAAAREKSVEPAPPAAEKTQPPAKGDNPQPDQRPTRPAPIEIAKPTPAPQLTGTAVKAAQPEAAVVEKPDLSRTAAYETKSFQAANASQAKEDAPATGNRFGRPDKWVALDRMPTLRLDELQKQLKKPSPAAVQPPKEPVNTAQQRRKSRLEEFFAIDEQETPPQKSVALTVHEADEYERPEDGQECALRLAGAVSKLIFQCVFLAILSVFGLYINLAPLIGLPLLPLLNPATDPYVFCSVNLAIGILAALSSIRTLGQGLYAAFTLTPGHDSLLALSASAAFLHNAVAVFQTQAFAGKQLMLFTPIAVLGLFLGSLGKLSAALSHKRNFKLVSADCEKYAAVVMENEAVVAHLNRLSSYPSARASASVKSGFLQDFFANTCFSDPIGRFNRIAAPVCLCIAVLLGIVCYFLGGNILSALTYAVAFLVLATPLISSLGSSVVLGRLSKKLLRKGAMVNGYDAANEIAQTNGVVIDAKDLFPIGAVTLHGVKTFEGQRIDEAILNVASVVYAAHGTYSDMFMEVIEGRTDILKKIDSYVYEDGMGVSAWIGTQRILIGNRALMLNHGIDVPSRDYEDRYAKKSRELLYLAVSGTLTAMFVLKYTPDEAVQTALDKLQKAGYDIFIKTNDSNISAQKIAEIYSVDSAILKIIPGSSYKELDKAAAPAAALPARVAHNGSFAAYAEAVFGSSKVCSSLRFSVILQIISACVCAAIVCFLAFSPSLSLLNTGVVFLIQLFWAAITLLLPNIGEV